MTKTIADLEALFETEASAKKAIKDPEVLQVLAGSFGQGRTSYLHTMKFPGGTELRLKFVNTVKQILNSKGKEVPGKESFLSYLEVTVIPVGQRGFIFSSAVTQVVWAPSKTKANEKHENALNALRAVGEVLGLDLSTQGAWSTVYSQSY